MIDQISKLREAGHPIKKIAVILGVSRNTVRRYLREEAATAITTTRIPGIKREVDWKKKLDWNLICDKRRQGYTAKHIYAEFEPEISYPRFCDHLREAIGKSSELAIRLKHNPAEKTQIDFCEGVPIIDHRSGKQRKTHLFIGVLPFSSFCFGVFVENQKLANFIRAHEMMWAYFGGVTPYVVVDNLKSGVLKAHRYDPEANPTYCDYGNHAKFAVLPTRPYTPRDKAAVEANIGAIQRSFFQKARDKNYYNLQQLNDDFRRFLDEFNSRVMPDYGVSRRERFEVEKPKLLSLPANPYEISEWREAKVHPDCCIQIENCFYSVPHHHRGQTVRVKIADKLITIYDKDVNAIACHQRTFKKGDVVSEESHFPDSLMQSQSFDVKKALAKAEAVGPYTDQLVKVLLNGDRPLRYLRRVQGIFRLLDRGIGNKALEYASSQALTFSKMHLSFIKACAEQYQLSGGRLTACRPSRDPGYVHLRGGYDV